MEKLQAAIHKARQARQGNSAPLPPIVGQESVHKESLDLWQAVKSFDASPGILQKHRLVTRDAGPDATPFDVLRTKVLLQMRQRGWKRLAITSPMPRSGKSITACNLALGLGRQREISSILLDLDLRDPSVATYFDTKPEYGIGDVLRRKVDFADQAQRIGENVIISMAREPEVDPTRVLLAEETAQLLDNIEETYQPDVMIFDMPSMLVNDETRAFLKNVDCALVVIRAGMTRYGQFDAAEREIAEQTNVLGVVLNAYNNYDGATSSED